MASISIARRIPTVLFGLLLIAGLVSVVRKKQKKKQVCADLGAVSAYEKQMPAVFCHAAKSDGTVDPYETNFVADIAADLTGTRASLARVASLIDLSQKSLLPSECRNFAVGLTEDQKGRIMRGVLMILSDGESLDIGKHRFITGLSKAFKLSKGDVPSILHSIYGPASPSGAVAP